MHAQFEKSIRLELDTVVAKANGFQRYEISRGIQSAERSLLQILWQTMEDHTIGFVNLPHTPNGALS
jgi:hypothetical protein